MATQDNGVYAKHPEYVDREDEWRLMRDATRGETAVKAAGIEYLPMPAGFLKTPDKGVAAYAAYKERAQFPEIVQPTSSGMVGIIHRTEAQITMPDAMQTLWEKATKDGLPLEAFHRRITTELLTTGRFSILVDALPESEGGSEVPYLAGYKAEALINWDDNQSFYVLDESGLVRDGFEWKQEDKARVLELSETGVYTQTLYKGTTPEEATMPVARGGAPLREIPFVIMGTTDLSIDPDDPPLLGVARSAKTIYQLSADYRYQLFQTGQETLVVINADEPKLVGAGVIISLKADGGADAPQPDAKYVSPSGSGISAHREAIKDEREVASQAGARLFASGGQGQESGEALRIRYAAETATLTSISQVSAQGLERALKFIAQMMGMPQGEIDKIVVKPNLRFVESTLSPSEAVQLVKLWQDEAISYETLYENLQRGEIASSERDFEEELKIIDEEVEEEMKRREEQIKAGLLPNPAGATPPTNGQETQDPPLPGQQPTDVTERQ